MKRSMVILTAVVMILLSKAAASEYERVRLLNEDKKPLKSSDLEEGVLYVYSYPYEGTPSIMIKNEQLDENNRSSTSIVSYLAINPKTYEFINEDISVISFYKDEGALRFCDDKGTYDIKSGEDVFDINATKKKMTKVLIEYDDNGAMTAVGLSDDDVVKTFFKEKKSALVKRYKNLWGSKRTRSSRKVEPLEKISLVTVRCNEKIPLIVADDVNKSYDDETMFIETEENISE